MARPRKNAAVPADAADTTSPTSEPNEEQTAATAESLANGDAAGAPVVKQRRRRRKSTPVALVNETSDASALVAALLRSRGEQGATQDDFHVLIAWARGIRDESTALNMLSARPRQQKTQAPTERLTRYEMNRALLEGVIEGSIGLDVVEDGTLRFVSQQVLETSQTTATQIGADEESANTRATAAPANDTTAVETDDAEASENK